MACEIAKHRRTFRDQDPPRIRDRSTDNLLQANFESSKSTPSSPIALQRASSLEKCFSDPEFFKRQQRKQQQQAAVVSGGDAPTSSSREDNACTEPGIPNGRSLEDFCKELIAKVPSSCVSKGVTVNGIQKTNREVLKNGKDMPPVLGVPPPPPPAPHIGPDGFILPRKPYNPCLHSPNHQDLHRELRFNQKVGRDVLNQKSELQRAFQKHRETNLRKQLESQREDIHKDDPRTVLQRAIEQRAKHIKLMEQPPQPEPQNPLVTARAKLRPRRDSQ